MINVLPAKVADLPEGWNSVKQVCRIVRFRQMRKKGKWQKASIEIAYAITSLPPDRASPKKLLSLNRGHWSVENILHRAKDFNLHEDKYTNCKGNAPRNIATLNNLALTLIRRISPKITQTIEELQNDKDQALQLLRDFY